MADSNELPPLSPAAVDANDRMRKMVAELEEEERKRRIAEEKQPNEAREKMFNRLIFVQEDLLHTINLLKVKEATETERVQRITTEKKHSVHEELLRKAAIKETLQDEEDERARRIAASKDQDSDEYKARMRTYDQLVHVQEHLLRSAMQLKAKQAIKRDQQEREAAWNKAAMQEQLVHKAHMREALEEMNKEQSRRIAELSKLSQEEIEHRVQISDKLLEVQKELLTKHTALKPIPDHHSQQVLDDIKFHMQEQLLRKAHQKDAIAAMEEERKRRVEEEEPHHQMSDQQARVLEEMERKASITEAKKLADEQQQAYIRDEQRTRAQEEAIRHVHQRQADAASKAEQKERIEAMEGKPVPLIQKALKEEIVHHHK